LHCGFAIYSKAPNQKRLLEWESLFYLHRVKNMSMPETHDSKKTLTEGLDLSTILLLVLLALQLLASIAILFRINQVYQKVSESSSPNEPVQDPAETLSSPSERFFGRALPDHVPTRGPDDAPVRIIVFSRFSCRYCGEMTTVLDQVTERYEDQVQIAFRHFPTQSTDDLDLYAAIATACAGNEGKFWEMHDQIFLSRAIDMTSLLNHAEKIGLDVSRFQECLISRQHEQEIRRDVCDGETDGIRVVPTLFINGQMIEGAVPFSILREIIEDTLNSSSTR
jgi:protein-disulfide isomerase